MTRPRRARATGWKNPAFRFLLCVGFGIRFAAAAAAAVPEPTGEKPGLTARTPLGAISYVPGRGLRFGSTGLVVGGFTNVKAESAEESGGEFSLDNLNLFLIFDRFTRFRAVAELQLSDVFLANAAGAGTRDFAFDVRRLFGELIVTDELHVRAGTFLTPVGYWNLLRAPPLTWTTEPPLIVEETFFQPTTTGVMLSGSTEVAGGALGYSAFSQFLKPIEDDPDLDPPNLTAGVRLEYDTRLAWSAGATYQAAENAGEWSHLGGVHLLWQHRRGQVLSETYFQSIENLSAREHDEPGSSQWGTYLQGVVDVYGPFHLVGRYEHFDPPFSGPAVNAFTLGGVWKPFSYMAVKIEYRVADHDLEEESLDGFFSSFTTLF